MDFSAPSDGLEQLLRPDPSKSAAATRLTASQTGLYVHLPWCAKKCPYCDFNSYESRGVVPEADYVSALLRDLQFERTGHPGDRVTSIYIGGGTPSLFSAREIGRLLEGIHAAVAVAHDAEITLEANPGTIETGRLRGFRDAGVNRVSIGVQSLRDAQLARLGRVHTAEEARNAASAALSVGFTSVNIDVMFGLPGDDAADGLYDLREALQLDTPHLSWYQLTLEPNTAWDRRAPAGMPGEGVVERIETAGRELLEARGFRRYEISAWARAGHRCSHNLNYWRFGDYVGIGAGAHSKRRLTELIGHERYSKLRNPRSYMNAAGSPECVEIRETVSQPRAIALEYFMNALRLLDGVPAEEFAAATGLDAAAPAQRLMQAQRLGLLARETCRWQLTERGVSQLNRVLRLLC